MRKNVLFTAIAVAAVLSTACENVEIPAPDSGNAIDFRALVDKNGTTKASLVDKTEDLTNFFVAAGLAPTTPPQGYIHNLDFLQTAVWRVGEIGSYTWNYAPNKYYPVDGTPLNFFAYAPIKDVNMGNKSELLVENDGKVYFKYTVPNNQSVSNTAVDLLVANVLGKEDDGTAVAFEFNHALSGVTFSAINNNPKESELVYVVSGIEISNLANEGTFTYPLDWDPSTYPFPVAAWKPSSDPLVTYTPGLPESGVSLMPIMAALSPSPLTYVNLLSANDIMMVLPQKTKDMDTFVKVTYSLKDGSGTFIYKGHNLNLPLPDNFIFEPGVLYNFSFQFAASEAITFNVTKLNNWDTQEIRFK